nr:hypothetical protein [Tanacetum cinerariifolium]
RNQLIAILSDPVQLPFVDHVRLDALAKSEAIYRADAVGDPRRVVGPCLLKGPVPDAAARYLDSGAFRRSRQSDRRQASCRRSCWCSGSLSGGAPGSASRKSPAANRCGGTVHTGSWSFRPRPRTAPVRTRRRRWPGQRRTRSGTRRRCPHYPAAGALAKRAEYARQKAGRWILAKLVERRLSVVSVGVLGLLLPPLAPQMSTCSAAPMLSSRHKKTANRRSGLPVKNQVLSSARIDAEMIAPPHRRSPTQIATGLPLAV